MPAENTLYYGDNLEVLRQHVKDESVDLVYLDPPFNSNATYNVLFAEKDGNQAAAQIKAFDDTWEWDTAAQAAFHETINMGGAVSNAMRGFQTFFGGEGRGNTMLAYLAMMAPRLVELQRVLKPTGSIYLHCDPTASHYLKLLMDAIFGAQNYRNEITWKRYSGHGNVTRSFGKIRDIVLFYTKADNATWNPQYGQYSQDYIDQFFRFEEEGTGRRYMSQNAANPNSDRPNLTYEWNGHLRVWKWTKEKMQGMHDSGRLVYSKTGFPRMKQYLDESKGPVLQDLWDDIPSLQSSTGERLGYPTQKPLALLERIIQASSDEGDVVLDPFCGCGTAVVAAQTLKRRWIGIDVTHLAVTLIKSRLLDTFGASANYAVVGEPTTVYDAEELAKSDPYQFQWWALGLAGARPVEQKKGADRGIDGRLFFRTDTSSKFKQIIFSVKAGHVTVSQVRDLRGVIDRESAEIGVLISFEPSTQPMRAEAGAAGFYASPWGEHPRIQLLTVEELLAGKKVDYPQTRFANVTFKTAPAAVEADPHEQAGLGLEG